MGEEQTFTATFTFEKETKNTYRLQEQAIPGKPPIVGTLYVQKYLFAQRPAEAEMTLRVTK